MHLITLTTFDNAVEVHIVKARLEGEGIQSMLQDENMVALNPLYNVTLGGIKLKVLAEDVERAQAVLQEIEQAPMTDDHDQVIHCPNCGSAELYQGFKSMKGTKGVLAAVISFLLMVFPLHFKTVYRCKHCETEFKPELLNNTSSSSS